MTDGSAAEDPDGTQGAAIIPPAGYADTRDYLFSLKNRGSKYGIDRMRLLVERIGHPQRSFPTIHVAGTNGKGSVCAMLEAIYRGGGYRTGLYTSPHLVRQGERVQVNRTILPESAIMAYTDELRGVADQMAADDPDNQPSFFEFMTAMAFLEFARQKVDIGIIETGLGGRLDATNVLAPQLSIITTIGLDHTEQLGSTLSAIAREKAGIIKPGTPVLIGRLPPEADAVIAETAAERNAPLHRVVDDWPDPQALPQPALTGDFQRWNAALAVSAVRLLQRVFPVKPDVIAPTLRDVRWGGRWETRLIAERTLILDASHNPEAAITLDANLAALRAKTGQRPIIITGILGEDRARAILPVIARHAREVYLTPPQQERATPTAALEQILRKHFNGPIHPATIENCFPEKETLAVGAPGDTIVLTGSIYLIGEVLARIENGGTLHPGLLQDAP